MPEMEMGQEKSEMEKLQQIKGLIDELIAAQDAEMGGQAPVEGGTLGEKLAAAGGENE